MQLKGWQLIVYQIIENHFSNEFELGDKGLIDFLNKGFYRKTHQIKKRIF